MNSTRWKRIAAALLAFCALGTGRAEAQETDERREWRREMRQTEEQRESLGVWFVHRLRSQLGLSKEQTLELLPHVEAIEATIDLVLAYIQT